MRVRPSLNPKGTYYLYIKPNSVNDVKGGFPVDTWNPNEGFMRIVDNIGDRIGCKIKGTCAHLHDLLYYPDKTQISDLYWIFTPESPVEESMLEHHYPDLNTKPKPAPEVPEALAKSIHHWWSIMNYGPDTPNSDECALCGEYYTGETGHCSECPVRYATHERVCHGTPYYAARREYENTKNDPAKPYRWHCFREFLFLLSLTPRGSKWTDPQGRHWSLADCNAVPWADSDDDEE